MDKPPSYISDLISFNSAPKSLRSANKALLDVPRSRLKFKGDRAFAVAAPRLWNQLPPDIKSAPSNLEFLKRIFILWPFLIFNLWISIVILNFNLYFILYFTVFYDCFVQHFGQCKLNLMCSIYKIYLLYLLVLTNKRSLYYKTSCKFQNSNFLISLKIAYIKGSLPK